MVTGIGRVYRVELECSGYHGNTARSLLGALVPSGAGGGALSVTMATCRLIWGGGLQEVGRGGGGGERGGVAARKSLGGIEGNYRCL